MENTSVSARPGWFRIAGILFLLWNLFGCYMFWSQYSMTPEQIAALPAGQQQLWNTMPAWAWVVYGVAVVSGALGAILPARVALSGHAIEARVCAEDPKTFFPSPGKLERFRLPEETPELRIETGYREGMSVTPFYDSLLAKVIAHGATREEARLRLVEALRRVEIAGTKSNVPFLLRLLEAPGFVEGHVHTGFATAA